MSPLDANVQRLARGMHGYGLTRTLGKVVRGAVFPKGSRRDKFWAYWLRPVVLLAMGRVEPAEIPMAELRSWTSPAARLFDGQARVASILVIKLDHIGDFLLALPALALLRRSFPEARITLLCGRWNSSVARKTGLFDEIATFEFFPGNADARRIRVEPRAVEDLGLPMFDLAVDLRVDEDTRVLLRHVSARCKAGYHSRLMPSDMAIVLPQAPVEPPDAAGILPHQRSLMLRLIAAVVAYFDPLEDSRRLIGLVTGEHDSAMAALRRGFTGPVVVINTSSGREIKNWPLVHFASICRWIIRDLGGTVVLIGGPAQKRETQALIRQVREKRLVSLVGTIPLDRSFAMIGQADLFLGNDSGLTHAAAMLEIPTVALYSGIDPIATWGPLGPKVTAIKANVPCSPCHLTHITDCSNGHVCMRSIAVDTVKQAILRYIGPEGTVAELPAEAGSSAPRLLETTR